MSVDPGKLLVEELKNMITTRRGSEPGKTAFGGKKLTFDPLGESHSTGNLLGSNLSFVNLESPRHVINKVTKHPTARTGGEKQTQKVKELSPRFLQSFKVEEKALPYTAKKEEAFDQGLRKFLFIRLDSEEYCKIEPEDIRIEIEKVYERSLDKKIIEFQGKDLKYVNELVTTVLEDSENELINRAPFLIPLVQNLSVLKEEVESFLFDTAKCKSRWAESLLNNITLLCRYLNFDEDDISIKGEQKLKIFLDVIDKTCDAKSLCIFHRLINNDKKKIEMVINSLRRFLNGDEKEKNENYIEKLVFIKLGMSRFKEKSYAWTEDSSSACQLENINRDQMIKSFVRDGKIVFSKLTIGGKLIKLIDEESDKYLREKNFISSVVDALLTEAGAKHIDNQQIITKLIKRQPTEVDPILWSLTISSWANAELMIREHLGCLFQTPYSAIISNNVDSSIHLQGALEHFKVTTRKSYIVYPCSSNRGHGADKHYPLMELFCSWTVSPISNKDGSKSWKGILEITGFEKKQLAPVSELCCLVRTIQKNIYRDG